MSEQDELRAQVRKTFGREVSSEQLQRMGTRLGLMLANAAVLEQWRGKLEGIEPAGVHKTPRLSDLGLEG